MRTLSLDELTFKSFSLSDRLSLEDLSDAAGLLSFTAVPLRSKGPDEATLDSISSLVYIEFVSEWNESVDSWSTPLFLTALD